MDGDTPQDENLQRLLQEPEAPPDTGQNQVEPGYLSLAQAAGSSPYSQEYISLLIRKGRLPGKKFGRNWYIRKEDLEQYVADQAKKAISKAEELDPDVKDGGIRHVGKNLAEISKQLQENTQALREAQGEFTTHIKAVAQNLTLPPQVLPAQPIQSAITAQPKKPRLPLSIRQIFLTIVLVSVLSAPIYSNLFHVQDQVKQLKTQYSAITAQNPAPLTIDYASGELRTVIRAELDEAIKTLGLGQATVAPGTSSASDGESSGGTPAPTYSYSGVDLKISNNQIVAALRTVLSSGLPEDIKDGLRGEAGPAGPAGEPGPAGPAGADGGQLSYIPNSGSVFGTTAPTAPQGSQGTIGSATYLSAKEFITEKLTVTGETTQNGPVIFNSTLTVNGDTDLNGALDVSGNVGIGGTLGVTGATSLSILSTSGLATLDSLSVVNNATVGGTFDATGAATFGSTGTFADLLTASNGLTLTTGAINLTGTSGAINLSGLTGFSVNTGANDVIFTSNNFNVTSSGINATVIGATTPAAATFTTLNTTGNVGIGGTLGVTGAATLSSTLNAAGATSLGSTLVVTGATTLNSTLNVSGTSTITDLVASGQIRLTGNTADRLLIQPSSDPASPTKLVTIKNAAGAEQASLDSSGNLSLGGNATVAGVLNLTGNATIGGNTSITGTLAVTGNTSLSTLSTSGLATLNSLSVTNAGTFGGTLTANGQLVATRAPSLAHLFAPSWPAGTSNVADSTLYVNPASSVADGNLIGAAVNGAVKFVVDAEGDIYGNNLILSGSSSAGNATITNLTVTDNSVFGDAPTDTVTFNAGISSHLIPTTDNTYDIGSAVKRWQDLYLAGSGNIDGNVGIGGNATVTGTFGVTGATSLSTLSTSGLATLNSASITNNATVGGTLGVTGAATLSSTLNAAGATTLGDTLVVTGATTLNSTLNVSGTSTITDLVASGQIRLTGNTADRLLIQPSSDPASPTKLVTIKNAAGAEQASLDSSGNLSLGGNATVAGVLDLTGNATIGGNTSITGTLAVTGNTSLSTLSTSGLATLNSLLVTNNATVGGTFSATGAATFGSTGSFASTLTASNGLTLTTGALNLTGTSGAIALSGLTGFSVNTGANDVIFTSNNFDVTATGINATVIGATTPAAATFTTLNTTGNVGIGGTLGVTGNTSLSTLSTSGLATLNSASITNNATVGGNLTVTGSITGNSATISSLTSGSVIFAGTAGAISQDNTNFFWDDTNNRLGIGTTGPGAMIDIYGTSATTDFRITRSASPSNYFAIAAPGGTNTQSTLSVAGTAGLSIRSNGGVGIGGYAGTDTAIPANGLIVSGNVGIGTTNPSALATLYSVASETKLEIHNAAVDGDPKIVWELPGVFAWQAGIDDSDSDKFKIGYAENSDWTNTALTIDTTGNVGIGTASPAARLHVVGGSIRIGDSTANSPAIQLFSGNNYTWTMSHGSAIDGIEFKRSVNADGSGGNNAASLVILNTGNVGIGTTSAGTLLQIGATTPTTAANGIQFGTDTSANLYRSAAATVRTDGSFIVGTNLTVNGGSTLLGNTTISGTLGVSGAVTFDNTFAVAGATQINSTLGATGAATFGSTGSFAGLLSANGGINTTTITASTSSNPANSVVLVQNSNAVPSGNLLQLQSGATPTDKFVVTHAGNTTIGGTLGVTGATSLSTLSTSGLATLNSASITNNATVGGTLGVTGATTIAGSLAANGGITVNTTNFTVSSTGNVGIGGTLNITGATTAAGLTATGFTLNGNAALNGNVGLGDAAADTITFNGEVNSNVIPAADNLYDLGSASRQWANIYAGTLVATVTTIPGTTDNDFILNSDNATADTEDARMIFERGSVTPDAIIKWDGTDNRFEINQPVLLESSLEVNGATITGAVSVGSTLDVAGNFAINTNKFTVAAASGNVGIGGTLGVTGATTLSSTLGVSGLASFTGGVSANDLDISTSANPADSLLLISNTNATPTGNLLELQSGATPTDKFVVDVSGNVTAAGTLGVTGNTSLTTLSTSGLATLNSLSVTNNATVGGTLGVTGATTLSSTLTVNGQTNSRSIIPQSNLAYDLGAVGSYWNNTYINNLFANNATLGSVNLGKTTIVASTTDYALSVNQQGTGDILNLLDNGTEVLTVLDGGNVGIGIANPGAKLEIAGSSGVGGDQAAIYLHDTAGDTNSRTWAIQNSVGTAYGTLGFHVGSTANGTPSNTPSMVLLNNGKVGIGTANPAALLSVGATSQFQVSSAGLVSSSAFGVHDFGSSGTGEQIITTGNSAAGASNYGGYRIGNDVTGNLVTLLGMSSTNTLGGQYVASAGVLETQGSGGLSITAIHASGAVRFYTGGSTERMRIASSGNVGIGTTNPSAYKLEVVGGIVSTGGGNYLGIARRDTNALAWQMYSSAGELSFYSSGDKMTITSAGNVGIGTTNPETKLDVAGDIKAAATGKLYFNTGVTYVGSPTGSNNLVAQGYNHLTLQTYNDGLQAQYISFAPRLVEAMRIIPGGNVGIGTTNPGRILDIQTASASTALTSTTGTNAVYSVFNNTGGDMYFGRERSTGGLLVGDSSAYAGVWAVNGAYSAQIATNGSTRMTINSSGNVGIGITNPGKKLDVNGTIRTGTSVTAGELWFGTGGQTVLDSGTGGPSSDFFRIRNWDGAAYQTVFSAHDGNVGIGTTNPGSKLHISGGYIFTKQSSADAYGAVFEASANDRWLRIGHNGTDGLIHTTYNSVAGTGGDLILGTHGNQTNQLVLDSGGNVGIGTTSPAQKLQVVGGNILLDNTYGLRGKDSAGTERDIINFSSGDNIQITGRPGVTDFNVFSGTTFTFKTGGSFGIGAATPLNKLTVVGSASIGSSSYNVAAPTNGLIVEGNVGIGTTSPGNRLHVETTTTGSTPFKVTENTGASGNFRVTFNSTSDPFAQLQQKSGNSIGYFQVANSAGTVLTQLGQTFAGGINWSSTGNIQIAVDSGNAGSGVFEVAKGSANGRAGTDGTSLLYINNSGSVGIGTTTPNNRLTVTTSGPTSYLNNTTYALVLNNSTSPLANLALQYDATNDVGVIQTGTVGVGFNKNLALNPGGGNVGIGTTTVPEKLVVYGNSINLGLQAAASSQTLGLKWINQAGTDISSITSNTGVGDFTFNPYLASAAMTIKNTSGNVGIGEASPGSKLSVSGGATVGATYDTTAAPTNGLIVEGNVGIGTTSPATKLEVAGQIQTSDASAISYKEGNYLVHSDEVEYSIADDATNSDYKLMKSWVVDKTGSVRITWAGYIQSGTFYWGWKIAKNNGATTLTQVNGSAASGSFSANLASGETSSVHAYRKFSIDVKGLTPGDILELWMVSSDAGGVPAAGNGQLLYAKEFRVHSNAPGGGTAVDSIIPETNFTIRESSASGTGPSLILQRSKGASLTAPTVVVNADVLGSVNFQGMHSTFANNTAASYGQYNTSARIQSIATENFSSTAHGSALTFATTGNTTTTLSERMRIDQTGFVGIGTTAPNTLLDLTFDSAGGTHYVRAGGTNASAGELLKVYRNRAAAFSDSPLVNLIDDDVANDQTVLRVQQDGTGDIVNFFDGATEVFTILDGGNVGIGTTNPSQILTLQNTAAQILFQDEGGTGRFRMGIDTDDETYFMNPTVSGFHFRTGGTGLANEKMTILSGGNVGIGTTNPGQELDIVGDIRLQTNGGTLQFSGGDAQITSVSNALIDIDFDNNQTDRAFIVRKDVGATTLFRVQEDGNVGIGTTGPGSLLQVQHTDVAGATPTTILTLGRNTSSSVGDDNYLDFQYASGAVSARIANHTNTGALGDLSFWTSAVAGTPVEKMRILANGNVGIGDTTPAQLLTIKEQSAGSAAIEFQDTDDSRQGTLGIARTTDDLLIGTVNLDMVINNRFGTANGASLIFGVGDTERMRILGSGNVGIGTTNPQAKLDVTGGIRVNSAGTVTSGFADAVNMGTWDALGYNAAGTKVVLGGYRASQFAEVGLYTNGSERLTIDTSGNVGIGTTNPGARLSIQNSAATDSILTEYRTTAGTNAATFRTSDTGHIFGIHAQNSGDIYIKDTTDNVLFYGKNGGNVGIGTTSPSAVLQVQTATEGSTLGSNTALWVSGGNNTSNLAQIGLGYKGTAGTVPPAVIAWSSASGSAFDGNLIFATADRADLSTAPVARMTIEDAGDIGISTTNPGAKLDIYGTGNTFRMSGSDDTSPVYQRIGTSSLSGMGYWGVEGSVAGTTLTNTLAYSTFISSGASGTALQLGTAGNIKMTIESGGDVGIGTTDPQRKLHIIGTGNVYGRFESSSTTGAGIQLKDTASDWLIQADGTNPGAGGLAFYSLSASAYRMTINSSGYVGIGMGSSSATKLLHAGVATDAFSDATAGIGIQQSGATHFIARDANQNTEAFFGVNASGQAELGTYTNHTTYFKTNNDTKMTILAGGNVGIGTSNPASLLTVGSTGQFNVNSDGDVLSGFTTLNGSTTANGAGTASTTLILQAGAGANFDVGNYVKVDSTSCVTSVNTCYAKITAKSTDTLTISPALTWADLSPVTEVHVPEIGGTDTAQTLVNRYGRGYFIDGIVAGNGSTYYTDNYVMPSGNFGIGTTNPGAALHIAKDNGLRIQDDGSVNYWQFETDSDGGLHVTDDNAAELLTLNNSGSLGIGTTNPGQKLDVSGVVRSRSYFEQSETDGSRNGLISTHKLVTGAGTDRALAIFAENAGSDIHFMTGGSVTTRLFVGDSGNVGIGTTNPTAAKLDVVGDINATTFYRLGGTAFLGSSGNYHQVRSMNSSGGLQLTASDGTVRVTMLDAGNVGIGTTNPGEKLAVFSTGANNALLLDNSAEATYDNALKLNTVGGTWQMRAPNNSNDLRFNYGSDLITFQSGGNVGIGTTGPAYTLQVGQNTASNDTAYSLSVLRNGTSAAPATWDTGTAAILITDFATDGPATLDTQALLQVSTGRIADSDTNAANALLFQVSNDNGSAFVVNGKRNVGIGTNGPATLLHVNGTTDTAAGTHGLLVLGPTNSGNISIDQNEIMARSNGVVSTLYLNADGGNVEIGSGSLGIGKTPSNLVDINTSSTTTGISLDGRVAVTGYDGDAWLRLNQSSSFASGVYAPTVIRSDAGFDVAGTTRLAETGNYTILYRDNGVIGLYLGGADAGNYYDNTTHYFRGSSGSGTFLTLNSATAAFGGNVTATNIIASTEFYTSNGGFTRMNTNQFYCNNASACHFNWSGSGITHLGNSTGVRSYQITQPSGNVLYPGSVSGLTDYQASYYLASHASWGLYSNTSLNAAGGLYDVGNRVCSASSYTACDSQYVNVTGDTMSGNLTFNNYGLGIVGTYASTVYQNVFSMGAAYTMPAGGGALTGHYGIAWTHTNVGGESKAGLGHQALFTTNGSTQTAIGTGIWTNGEITVGSSGSFTGNGSFSYGTLGLTSTKNGYYGINFGNTNALGNMMFDGSGNGGMYYASEGLWMNYFTNSTNHLNIMTSTDLGYTLGVSGTLGATGTITGSGTIIAGSEFYTSGGSSTRMNTNQFYCNNASDCYFNYSGTGNTLLGNGSGGSTVTTINGRVDVPYFIYQSHLSGCNAYFNSGWLECAPSDENLKNIDGGYEGGLSELREINTIRYALKESPDNHTVGFSAQNVQSALPEGASLVNGRNGEYLTLNTTAILALTVNAVQELDARTSMFEIGESGQVSLNQNLIPTSDANVGIGTDSNRFENVFTKSSSGYQFDIARNNGASQIQAGMLVAIEGEAEIRPRDSMPAALMRVAEPGDMAIYGVFMEKIENDEFIAGDLAANEYGSVATSGKIARLKVDNSGGSIAPGDFLQVSAAYPGFAAKADGTGTVVGMALASMNQMTGEIPVSLRLSYRLNLGQNANGNLTTLESDLDANGNSIFNVRAIMSLSGKWSFDEFGNLLALGHITVGKDTAGTATLTSGALTVDVVFEQAYAYPPKVTVTPLANVPGFWISNKTVNGFTINLTQAVTGDVEFDWHALAVEAPIEEPLPAAPSEPTSSPSGGSTEPPVEEPVIDPAPVEETPAEEPVIEEPAPEPAPEPVPAPAEEPAPEPAPTPAPAEVPAPEPATEPAPSE